MPLKKTFVFLCTLFAFSAINSFGATIRLAWDPNTEADLEGYYIYYGTNEMERIRLGKEASVTLDNLVAGATYTIYATAFNTAGLESEPSSPITYVPAVELSAGLGISFTDGALSVTGEGLPSQRFLLQATGALNSPWVTVQAITPTNGSIEVPLMEHVLNPRRFYR